ncbi:hypothetical protein N665_2080s0002 [Sinapis alba]|nr:hypothetical protein N665_2080s0002 [Sinapis alba]
MKLQKKEKNYIKSTRFIIREPRSTETPLNDSLSNFVAQTFKKPIVSQDFWSTITVDMDNITFSSQGLGSISSSQTFDSQSVSRNSNPPPKFVNQGLLLWNQTRECFVDKDRPNNNPSDCNQGSKINWNASSHDRNGGFLVEILEQDGLYD